MVMAGEQSGTLGKVLAQLAGFLEKQNAAKAKVRSSMIYPVFMMAVSIVVLSFLFTFVIPKIVKIFRDAQSALPFATVILIFISNIFVNYWWALIGFVIAASVSIKRFFRSHRGLIDNLILKLPGNIIQSLYYARFARTLGFLLDGGLPMLRAERFAGIYLHRDRVDFRKSIDGLAAIVEQEMKLDVFGAHLFLFCNKNRTKMKVLYWDRTGFAMWYKRLEKERFRWPKDHDDEVIAGSSDILTKLLSGLDVFQKPHLFLHYDKIG